MQKETVSYHEDDATGLSRAAHIERHEKQPMDMERLRLIMNYTAGMVAMVLGFIALYIIIYFMGTGGR